MSYACHIDELFVTFEMDLCSVRISDVVEKPGQIQVGKVAGYLMSHHSRRR